MLARLRCRSRALDQARHRKGTPMPMWQVYYSEGAYTGEDKQEFAEAITGLYTQFNLPAFYVTALFHELPADTFYIGGEQASGYIRIWVDHIARRIPDDY